MMNSRSWAWVALAVAVCAAAFFVLGRQFGVQPARPSKTQANIAAITKASGLEASIDPKDKSTLIVFRSLRDDAKIGHFAVSTLDAIGSLRKAQNELEGILKVRINLRSGDDKKTFEVSAEALKGFFRGELGEKTLWNEILSSGAQNKPDSGFRSGKDEFADLFSALEPGAKAVFENDILKIDLGLSRSWQSEAASVIVALSAVSEVARYYPANVEMIAVSDGTEYLLAFKFSALRDIASGKTSPKEFVSRLHLEKK